MANACSIPSDLVWQPTLTAGVGGTPAFDASFAGARRITLDEHAWVEHVPVWVSAADALFDEVVARAPWAHHTRRMYDRVVDEPRLTAWHRDGLDEPSLPEVLPAMAAALRARYDRAFDSVGAALYRDGHDSVAWHSDRVDPNLVEPVIAIVSLGSARTLRLRSKTRKGPTRPFPLLPGDLFVLGGATNATWEHSVPKVANAGARLSVQFRHST